MNLHIPKIRISGILTAALLFAALTSLSAQEGDMIIEVPKTEVTIEKRDSDDAAKSVMLKNVNIDAELMYGQYNNIFSSFSIIQSHEQFTYQLNTDFKRSNDFGYENSSFYDNAVEFTGQTEFFKTWTFIPLIDIYNESHGMFDNATYSREEKDKIVVLLKNEYKPTPTRWQFNFGGAQYVHRLVAQDDPVKLSFNKFNEEIEWERVFSASQKITLHHYSWQYYYSSSSPAGSASDDFHVVNEIMWSIKLFEYMKFSLSPMALWNRDAGWFPGVKAQLNSDSLKLVNLGLSYSYDMLPFQPEDYYFEQDYIQPNNSLPPGKIQRAEFRGTFTYHLKGNGNFRLSSLKLKTRNIYEMNNNQYNYVPIPQNLLTAETISASSVLSDNEGSVNFMFYSYKLAMSLGYIYNRYWSDEHITYRPEHRVTGTVSVNARKWRFTWSNEYAGSVYVDNTTSEKLDGALIGSLGLQVQMVESVFFNIKMNNLYDSQYSYRYGYPEPGFTTLVGLRIII